MYSEWTKSEFFNQHYYAGKLEKGSMLDANVYLLE